MLKFINRKGIYMKTSIKKLSSILLTATLAVASLAGCASSKAYESSAPLSSETSSEVSSQASQATATTVLKVGVCAGPYGDMFTQAIQPSLEKKGYKIELVEFSDYVQPNKALAEGDIQLNMFQHSVYLANFSKEYNLNLTAITEIPTAGMGVFSDKLKTLAEIPDGATVAIPNDVTNLARAIRVLAQAELVTIDPSVDASKATQNTLSANPKNLKFVEIEAPQLPRSLESVDLAVINGNFAIGAGLNLSDALYNEKLSDGYSNVIAVRTEDAEAQFAKDIVDIVHSDDFRNVINDANNQYSSFFKPKNF